MSKHKGFTNPTTDGIKGFISKGIRYLEKEIYYFPFNVTVPLNLFIKADGSTKLRTEYPLIEKDYSSPDPSSLATNNFPNMTNNTAPSPHIAACSSTYNSNTYAPSKVFMSDSYWVPGNGVAHPHWVRRYVGSKYLLISYSITISTTGSVRYPSTWLIQGYENDTFTDPQTLDSRTDEVFSAGATKTYTLSNPLQFDPAVAFRIYITKSSVNGCLIQRLNFNTITEMQYNTIKNNFVLPNLIDYEDSTQGYICLREHVARY